MLKGLKADLHVHTCLSPCAQVKLSPLAVVKQATALGVDVVGICDHNSAENAEAALEAARGRGVCVLPGMEVSSSEEVHILGLFDTLQSARSLQEIVYRNLPGENDEKTFGLQVVANADDEVLGFNQKLLIGSTTLGVDQIVDTIRSLGGLAVAAHIDRESFSLISQLGFVPDDLALDALEISPDLSHAEAINRYDPSLPLIQSSDAHKVEEVGRCCTVFSVETASIDELRMALREQDGRGIIR